MTTSPASTGPTATVHPLAFWRWKLHWQILLGLLIGAGLGYLSGASALSAWEAVTGTPTGAAARSKAVDLLRARWDYLTFDLVGDLFLNGLKLIVVPLVTTSIILAVASIGAHAGFGRLGVKTLLYFMSTSLIAILTGLLLINAVGPGRSESGKPLLTSEHLAQFDKEAATIKQKVGQKQASDFLNVFREMVPDNPIKAAAEGNMLGLIVCALLIGFFLSQLQGPLHDAMRNLTEAVYAITMKITDLVLRFAPLGVGMLVAATVSENYATLKQEERFGDFVASIVAFALCTFVGLLVHLLVVMPVILMLAARVNPLRHYKAMLPALMTAFSTASSNATLPVNMECIEKAGVSKKVSSFVLPLGATVNMDGTALYECTAAIFIAQAFGVELSFGQQFFVVVAALLTSVGVAGVPSASLVAIVIILQSLTQQLEAQGVTINLAAGLPILLVFDRPLDMCRTAVNIFSDSVGAVVVARSEGETGVLAH